MGAVSNQSRSPKLVNDLVAETSYQSINQIKSSQHHDQIAIAETVQQSTKEIKKMFTFELCNQAFNRAIDKPNQ